MYKIVIIEDEKIAADNLVRMIKEFDTSFKIIIKIESVRTAVEVLPSIEFDLVFMDIHLTDGSSFEILDKIELNKPIIFTTAYDEYVLKAFKYLSIDYLLKPLSQKELVSSIKKFQKHFSTQPENRINLTDLQSLLKKEDDFKNRFLVQVGKKLNPVLAEQISHFQSSNKITYLYTKDKKRFPIDPSLLQLEKELNPNQFFRINRQYIISRTDIHHIYMVSPTKMKVVLKSNLDLKIFTSIDRMAKFKNWMK
jgi:two-component system response regulator LytT